MQCHYITATKGVCAGQPQPYVGLPADARLWGEYSVEGPAEATEASRLSNTSGHGISRRCSRQTQVTALMQHSARWRQNYLVLNSPGRQDRRKCSTSWEDCRWPEKRPPPCPHLAGNKRALCCLGRSPGAFWPVEYYCKNYYSNQGGQQRREKIAVDWIHCYPQPPTVYFLSFYLQLNRGIDLTVTLHSYTFCLGLFCSTSWGFYVISTHSGKIQSAVHHLTRSFQVFSKRLLILLAP